MDRAWKQAIMIGAGAFVAFRYVLPALGPGSGAAPAMETATEEPAQYLAADLVAPARAEPARDAPYAYYPNCAAARRAGVAPLHRWDPGYRPQLDRDNDGEACEPYR